MKILQKGKCPHCGKLVNAKPINKEVNLNYYPPCLQCMMKGLGDVITDEKGNKIQ